MKISLPELVLLFKLLVVACVALAFFGRLYRFGTIPFGYTWDEVGIAYDGWALATLGTDHLGNNFPLVFESFGDYKAPLLPYLMGGLYLFLPFRVELVRWISLFFGLMLWPITYLLAKRFFNDRYTAWLAMVLVALSPVMFHWSRVGFEAHMALVLFAGGVYFLTQLPYRWSGVLGGAVLMVLSFYGYQSLKIVLSLFLLGWILWARQRGLAKIRLWTTIGMIIVGMIPFALTFKAGSMRAEQTLLFFHDAVFQPTADDWHMLGNNLMSVLSPAFWLFGHQDSLRNMVTGFGPIFWFEIPMVVVGLLNILSIRKKGVWLLGWWLIVALIPSLLSRESPHMLRMNLIFPVITIIGVRGVVVAGRWFVNKTALDGRWLLLIFLSVVLVTDGFFLSNYFYQYSFRSSRDFVYGYRQVVEAIRPQLYTADQIVFTNTYGQPYIFVLAFAKITPKDFLSGGLANMTFRPITETEFDPDTLYVGTADEIDPHRPEVTRVFYYPGTEEVVFVLVQPS